MNQDSEDGLTHCQKFKKSEILAVSSNNEEEEQEYTPVGEYYGIPEPSPSDVGLLFNLFSHSFSLFTLILATD